MCCVSWTSFAKLPSKFASRFFIGPFFYLWWGQINPGDLGNSQSFQTVVCVIWAVGDDKVDVALGLMSCSKKSEINVLPHCWCVRRFENKGQNNFPWKFSQTSPVYKSPLCTTHFVVHLLVVCEKCASACGVAHRASVVGILYVRM